MPSLVEPVFMSDPDYDRIAKIVYASYPKACILMIDRIKNPTLTERYEAQRAAMGAETERIVYHGTKSHLISSIITNGFLAKLNRTSAYGLGTYFARDFGYSYGYSDTDTDGISNMFLCRILTGEVALGQSGARVPADDCCVNSITTPSIYVIHEDSRTLPEFLVRYHKTT